MDYVVWPVQIHRDRRQAASSCLSEHLGMTLENAREKENIRSPHFFSESRGRQMPQESNVVAIVLPAQGAAALLGFTATCHSKLHTWPAGGLLNHQFDPLPRL